MRQLFILLVPALLLTGSCDHKPETTPECLTVSSGFEPENCPDNGNCSFEFYPDSKLAITDIDEYLSFEVKAGTGLVFHFRFIKKDHPMIMDDEYQEDIYFEAHPEGDSFLITTDDLSEAGVLFGRSCFCMDGGYHRMESGCIYGEKVNDCTWNISLNLTATTDQSSYNRMKQKDFSRRSRPE